MTACIGEPISWLRLELFAHGADDPAARDHVAACAACRSCLHEIQGDIVALPALLPAAAKPRRAWWWWAAPAALAAAAVAIVVIVRPRPGREDVVAIKGLGDVVVDVVRERGGTITWSARTFAPGDRWKVVVTCPPSAGAWLDVAVLELGGAPNADYPLAPAHVACGNRVVVPGAFELTGARPNRVCVRAGVEAAPARSASAEQACVTVTPE
jgi:hypothetical protein